MVILLYIIYSFYSILSGMKDAVLWSRKGTEAFGFDEHLIFIMERIAVLLAVVISCYGVEDDFTNMTGIWTTVFCSALSFPFLHNGSYYQSRKWIDNSYLGFYADSKTSTSFINFSFPIRSGMFLIAIAYLLCYEYYF